MDAKALREAADQLFSKRSTLMIQWQDMAINFYPERADFTYQRSVGMELAADLMSSYPPMCRRKLADQIGQMLRPTNKDWFHPGVTDESHLDNPGRRWLQQAGATQRRAMYDRKSLFTKATKQADGDYSAFGQAVISVRLNRNQDALLYQCWHLRDVAWAEGEDGQINFITRKWKPTARDLMRLFEKTGSLHPKVGEKAEKDPFCEVECYHFIVEADMYGDDARGKPYWSIFYDCDHDHLIQATAVFNKEYAIPRWQQVSGSQYAYSPATVIALPEARLLQSMTYTLLEAGEKAANPPIVATHDVVRSDLAIYAGGVTWIERDYDERLGDALRPLTQDFRGLPFGKEMAQESRAILMQAFYLDVLNMPTRGPEMTAYEVGQRVQAYIRDALPLFEPMESEYNGELCDLTFDLLMRAGAFGSLQDMPPSLMGQDVKFSFRSPLHDAIEEQKGQKFVQATQIIGQALPLYPAAAKAMDFKTTLRDTLNSIGVPAKWQPTEQEQDAAEAQEAQQQQTQAMLANMQTGADAANSMAQANKTNAEAAVV